MSADNTARIAVLLDSTSANAAARQTSKEIDNIGDAGKRAGVSASAGLSQVEAATKAAGVGTEQLANQKAMLLAQIRNVDTAVRGETKVLADAQNAVKNLGTGHRTLDAAVTDSQAKLTGYIQQQGLLKDELARVTGLMRQSAVATEQKATTEVTATVSALEAARAEQALALANAETAAASELSARQMLMTAGAASRVAGAAIPGARSLGVLAGAFGSMGLVQLAVIAGIGILIGEFFKLGKAQEEIIKLDDEQIAADIRLNQAMQTGNLFTRERATVIHDMNALNVQLKQSMDKLHAAHADEAIAIGHSNQYIRDAAANYSDLQTKVSLYVYCLFAYTGDETKATAARLEASKTINDQIEARIKLAAETGKTKEMLEAELKAVINDTDVYRALTLAIEAGAYARERIRAGQSSIEGAKANVALAAAEKGIDLTKNHAEAARMLTQELTRQGEEIYHNAQVTELAQKNMRAFNSTTDDAAKLARQAVHEESIWFQLRKENLRLDEQLGKHNFEAQREAITQEFEERRRLEHDKAVLRKASAEEIRLIDYEIVAQELKTLTLNLNAEIEYRHKVSEEHVKLLEHQRGVRVKDTAELVTHLTHQRNVRIEEEAKTLKELDKLERERRIDRPGRAAMQADAMAAQAAEVNRVASAFGRASRNAHVYDLQLLALRKFDKGDYFGGLRASIKAVTLDMLESGQMAQSMADLLESAFSRSIASGDGFLRTLGASLIQGMTDIVAQVLKQIGVMLISKGIADVLMGIAWNSNPLTPGAGTALIHAGTAEIIEGSLLGIAAGVVSGLGGLAANSIKGNQAAGANGGAGAGTSNSTGNNAPVNNGPIPQVISFPTSGGLNTTQPIIIQLDRSLSKDLIEGKQVVTMPMLRGATARTELGQKIKKLAS